MYKFREIVGCAGPYTGESKAIHRLWWACQIVLLLVCVWLAIQLALDVDHVINLRVRYILIWVFWGVFWVDVLLMLVFCQHRLYYLAANWLTILVLLAGFPLLWHYSIYSVIVRFFQIILLLFLLVSRMGFFAFMARHKIGWVILSFIAIAVLSGVLLGFLDPGIGGVWSGIWWAFQTITLVGYGNLVPHTVTGQVFSIVVMLLGVCMVAIVSATIVGYFFSKRELVAQQVATENIDHGHGDAEPHKKNDEKSAD